MPGWGSSRAPGWRWANNRLPASLAELQTVSFGWPWKAKSISEKRWKTMATLRLTKGGVFHFVSQKFSPRRWRQQQQIETPFSTRDHFDMVTVEPLLSECQNET